MSFLKIGKIREEKLVQEMKGAPQNQDRQHEKFFWKHDQGAFTRSNLFKLNDEILSLPTRNRQDSDHILDPTLGSSQHKQNTNNKSIQQSQSVEEIKLIDGMMHNRKLSTINIHKSILIESNNVLASSNAAISMDSFKKIDRLTSNDTSVIQSPLKTQKELTNKFDFRPEQCNLNYGNDFSRKYEEFKSPPSHNPKLYEKSPSENKFKLSYANDDCLNSEEQQRKSQKFATFMGEQGKRDSFLTVKNEIENRRGSQKTINNFFVKMKVSQLTKKFIQKILAFSSLYNFKLLKKKHYDIIGDQAASFNADQQHLRSSKQITIKEKLIQLCQQCSLFFDSIEPINPESRCAVICDIFYAIVLLAYLFVVPIELSFRVQFNDFSDFVFAVLLVNFVLSINKSFYSQGRMISNRKKIFHNFLKTQFLIDLAVFISLRINYFQFVGFLKFNEIHQIIKRADNHFQMIRKYPIAFTLTNLVVQMTLIAQIAGCAFHYVAYIEIQQGEENNWLASKGVQDDEWISRYIISIYFSFITMMTVGYGDVTPVNNTERIYVIFMTLLSSAIFGYVVNTIGELYMQQRQKLETFQKRKQEITVYMDERQIDNQSKLKVTIIFTFIQVTIYTKVLNYLEYAYQYQKKNDSNSLTLFQDIPQNLVDEIQQKYYGKYLQENKIMKLNFSDKCLKSLSLFMKEKNIAPNEFLFQKGERGSTVYFLTGGTIDTLIENQDDSVPYYTITKHGEEIGLRNAFIDSDRMMTVKCSKEQSCTLVYFEMQDFKSILQKYQKDYERYCELRDDIIFNQQNLDTKCSSCLRYDHLFINCPLISLCVPAQNVIFKSQSGGEPNVRNNHSRRKFTFKTMAQNMETRDLLKKYRVSLVQLMLPDIKEYDIDINNVSDRFFFTKIPTVKLVDGDLEPDAEEYNIYEDYQTFAADENGKGRLDEDNSERTEQQKNHELLEENHLHDFESVENVQLSSTYSSQANQQQNINQERPSSGQNILNNLNINPPKESYLASQKVVPKTKFSKKVTTLDQVQQDSLTPRESQLLINQNSARNLSFRRERGDSFYPPLRQKQFTNQISLNKVKTSRNLSEIQISSSKPQSNNFPNSDPHEQASFVNSAVIFILDFDKMKIFEKYFPSFNYPTILRKIALSKKAVHVRRGKKVLKTIIINSSHYSPRKIRKQ